MDDVTSYDLDVALDDGFDQQVADSLNKDEAGSPVNYVYTGSGSGESALQPGTTYYWRVRADAPVQSSYSDVRSFTVGSLAVVAPPPPAPAPTPAPVIGAPVNGVTGSSQTPSFSWNPVSGSTEYQFKLANNVALANPIADVKVKTTGYALTKELELGKTYYWAVKSLTPEGAWSALANFTVMEAPAPPPPPPPPPVVIKEVPAPVINIPAPPPAQEIVIPPPPPAPAPITPAYIWAIIIIGAVLVIAVIVLIVRTRRAV